MRQISLGICIPDQGVWKSEFGRSVALTLAEIHKNPIVPRDKQRVLLLSTQGTGVAKVRHLLVKKALQEDCDYILFVDTDMSFPQNIAHYMYGRMIERDISFLAANCVTRVGGCRPTAFYDRTTPVFSKDKKGVEEVNHVGLAVAMIAVKPIKQMTPPLFLMDWIPEYQDYCGEDIYFCELWKQQTGLGIYVDHDLSKQIGHVGSKELTLEDIDVETANAIGT